nr:DALR anticodon-binding domain-containing protein [Streptomyces sp. SID13726]
MRAVRRAVDGGELDVPVPGHTQVTPPGPGGCGDYATNVALQLARPAGQPPLRVAEILRGHLVEADGISEVVVTGPGFLNISVRGTETALVREILRSGRRYGHAERPTGQLVQLHADREVRAVVVMDAVARILRSQGAHVRTSCAGRPAPEWTDVLGASIDVYGTPDVPAPSGPALEWARVLGASVDVYGTPDVPAPSGPALEWARVLGASVDVYGTPETPAPPGPAPEWTDVLRASVDAYGTPHTPTPPDPAPESTNILRASIDTYGTPETPAPPNPTPDSTGTLRAGVDPHGTPEPPTPLAVNIRPTPADTDPTPLGRDAARWALLHPAAHDRVRGAADLLVQCESNPLFRVRYAHARTRALHRNAADLGFHAEPGEMKGVGAVVPDDTSALYNALADHPRVLRAAAVHHAPDRLARHLVTVADAVLPFLATVLPRGAEKPSAAHRARLALAEAAGAVLAGGLSLLGIDAPEHL